MRILITIIMSTVVSTLFAQSPVKEIFEIRTGKSLSLKFDYPQLMKIETWDRNEILITGKVNINNGEHDNKFKLVKADQGDMITIEGKIPDIKDLPQLVMAIDGKDTMTFRSKEEYERYSEKSKRKFRTITMGPQVMIRLEIKVPKNIATQVESTYGMVEVKDFKGPISVQAKYGGIDATLQTRSIGELTVETNYGMIYSNLDLNLTGSDFKDFRTLIIATPGNGPSHRFESKFGNIYLRK